MYVELNRRQQRDKPEQKDKWAFKENSTGWFILVFPCCKNVHMLRTKQLDNCSKLLTPSAWSFASKLPESRRTARGIGTGKQERRVIFIHKPHNDFFKHFQSNVTMNTAEQVESGRECTGTKQGDRARDHRIGTLTWPSCTWKTALSGVETRSRVSKWATGRLKSGTSVRKRHLVSINFLSVSHGKSNWLSLCHCQVRLLQAGRLCPVMWECAQRCTQFQWIIEMEIIFM